MDKKGNVGYPFIVIMSLSMAFAAQIRPNGLFLILISAAFLSLYLFKKFRLKKLCIAIPALTVIFILLIASLNVIYDVEDTQKDAVLAKLSHMIADYDLNLDLSDEDRAKVHELFSESDIKKSYNLTFSDRIQHYANKTVYNSDKLSYFTLAIKYSVLNPTYFIKYLFGSSPMVWNIVRSDDWVGTEYVTSNEWSWQAYYIKRNRTPVCDYEVMPVKNNGTPMFEKLDSFVNDVKKDPLSNSLLNSPALYMYLSFILIGAIFLLTKSKDIFMVYMPNMLNIIIIFLSTPTQDVRYLYPDFLMFYLLVIILMSILIKAND